jgi:hypothetical protein
MRNFSLRRSASLLVFATAVAAAWTPSIAAADPVLDQSVTGPTTGQAAIGQCCAYIGQTFTAGRTGVLESVSVEVGAGAGVTNPLDVQIRTVDSAGLPTTTVLGETFTSSSSFLDQLITFPQTVLVSAGTQYAIVVNYDGGGGGGWDGGIDDPYPAGSAVASSDNGASWFAFTGWDLEFETYTSAPPVAPTSKDQCKSEGWQTYPQFRNQGDCVSFVENGK